MHFNKSYLACLYDDEFSLVYLHPTLRTNLLQLLSLLLECYVLSVLTKKKGFLHFFKYGVLIRDFESSVLVHRGQI